MAHGVLGLHEAASAGEGPSRARRALALGLVPVLLVVGVTAWLILGRSTSADAVSRAEALAFFDHAVDVALSRDFAALCRLNGASKNCEWMLEQAADKAPSSRPVSVEARYVPTGSGVDVPGWMLTVKGRDAHGADYDTQVMVFREGTGLKAINIVWWSGARLVPNDVEQQTAEPVG